MIQKDGPPLLIPHLPDAGGLYYGLKIHRFVEPRDWPAAIAAYVPEPLRPEAERYLRDVAAVMRSMRRMQREAGCTGTPEQMEEQWVELKRIARECKAPGVVAWHRAGRPITWRNGEPRTSREFTPGGD